MIDWACWLLERPNAFKRKTVKLVREERAEASVEASAEAIFARVARTIEHAGDGVTLLIAPTGSRKSTTMRAAAVRYVTEHPEQERRHPGAPAQARRRAGQGASEGTS